MSGPQEPGAGSFEPPQIPPTATTEERLLLIERSLNVYSRHHEVLAHQMAEMVTSMSNMHRDLRTELVAAAEKRAEMAQRLADHIAAEEEWLQNALPEGDAAAHKQFHEQSAKAGREAAEDWRSIRLHLAKTGMVGALVLVLGLLAAGSLSFLATKLGIKLGGG